MANKRTLQIESIDVKRLKSLFAGGKLASVAFIKKSDGSTRVLNGKLSVKSALVGGQPAYDAESKGQLRVCDVNVYTDRKGNKVPRHSEFRSVTASNVLWVTSRGVKYIVKHPSVALNFVQSIQYNAQSKVLTLKLNNRTYKFYKVSTHIHRGLVDSTNKGSYFNERIKGQFDYVEVK